MCNLSNAVSKERASDLLHSMATSRDILFWTPRGQLPRNKRIIHMTNIAEIVEYVLLPHNDDVTKPRALSTFSDGLAELGVDKGVIKNKKVLIDLIEKEKGFRNGENTSENESKVESSSGREQEEIASANGSEAEDKRATTTLKTTVRKQKVIAMKRPPPFTLKIPVNIVRILMCMGH